MVRLEVGVETDTVNHQKCVFRFIIKGGIMILATWLSQAAVEEQTTVLLVILKVHNFYSMLWVILYFTNKKLTHDVMINRFFVTSLYIKLYQFKCQLYCKVLIGCGFTEHQVWFVVNILFFFFVINNFYRKQLLLIQVCMHTN